MRTNAQTSAVKAASSKKTRAASAAASSTASDSVLKYPPTPRMQSGPRAGQS